MMFSINSTCLANWEEMKPATGGRYCAACQKMVHDFRECSDEEIVVVIRQNGSARTCGRFRKAQLDGCDPKSRLIRFASAALLVFSFGLFVSCSDHKEEHEVMGDVSCENDSMLHQRKPAQTDTAGTTDHSSGNTMFHLSREDSTHIADSIERSRNHVRDFQ